MKKTLPWILAGTLATAPAFGADNAKKPAKTGIIPVGAIALLLNKKPTTPVLKEPVDFGQFKVNTEITGTLEVTGESTTGICEAYKLPENVYTTSFNLVNSGKIGEYAEKGSGLVLAFVLPGVHAVCCLKNIFDPPGIPVNVFPRGHISLQVYGVSSLLR
ncbi:hypothetical protein [Thermincola ferriacetica]